MTKPDRTSRDDTASRAGVRVVALTPRGSETAAVLGEALRGSLLLPLDDDGTLRRGADGFSGSLATALAKIWGAAEAIVGAMPADVLGEAVRPLLSGTDADPLAVAVAEDGSWAAGVAGGHPGGLDALARRAAAATGGLATTTPLADAESVGDLALMARALDLAVSERKAFDKAASALAEGAPVAVVLDHPCAGWERGLAASGLEIVSVATPLDERFEAAVYVGSPTPKELAALRRRGNRRRPVAVLAARRYVVGIDGDPGASVTDVLAGVDAAVAELEVDIARVRVIAVSSRLADAAGPVSAARGIGADLFVGGVGSGAGAEWVAPDEARVSAGAAKESAEETAKETAEEVARAVAGGPIVLGALTCRGMTVALASIRS